MPQLHRRWNLRGCIPSSDSCVQVVALWERQRIRSHTGNTLHGRMRWFQWFVVTVPGHPAAAVGKWTAVKDSRQKPRPKCYYFTPRCIDRYRQRISVETGAVAVQDELLACEPA